jgi:hypothetical protein
MENLQNLVKHLYKLPLVIRALVYISFSLNFDSAKIENRSKTDHI